MRKLLMLLSIVAVAGAAAADDEMHRFGDTIDCGDGAHEVDPRTDAKNCGGCGHVCGTQHARAVACVEHRCRIECAAGYANCNGSDLDGCETAGRCGH